MKKFITASSIILFSIAFSFGCGGGGGNPDIDGPTLSMNEALSLLVDQLYINGGLDDEYASRGEFSIYLRDAATGQDVACASAEDGMEELGVAGIYYGGLTVPLREVEGDHPSEMARFQVVFVERDGAGCPEPIDDEDDIAGISPEFTFENLLDQQIWAMNGKAAVVLRDSNEEIGSVRAMAPSLASGLIVDKLYFENGSDGEEAARYYIFADRVKDGQSVYQCQIEDEYMDAVRFGGIVYAALGFPISCFSPTDPEFDYISVRLGLYTQKDSGPTLVAETEGRQIGDLIGERIDFTNGAGFVTFGNVMTTPFSASVVRLGELEALVVDGLEYALAPSFAPTVEVHVTNSSGDYVIACVGPEQGLVGVDTPGTYEGLDARLVGATGQEELVGWEKVLIRLVDRDDGLSCPSPLGAEPTILAETAVLTSANLGTSALQFENGAGQISLSVISNNSE